MPVLLSQSPTHANGPHDQAALVTAAQIGKDCPIEVAALGFRIRAQLKTMRGYEAKAHEKAGVELRKADDNWTTVTQLLAEAKAKCSAGGFKAFKKKFCPNLGRSRIYELLRIGSGKETLEESRAAKRASVAKSRKKGRRVSATNDVVDKLAEVAALRGAEPPPAAIINMPVADGVADDKTGVVEVENNVTETAEERANAEYADWLEASDKAAKASAHCLAEFTAACRKLLPKMTEKSHREKARQLVCKMIESPKAEAVEQSGAGATLGSAIEHECHEAERVFEALTAHTVAQVAQAIPSEKAALVTEIADYFTALAAKLTARSAGDGEAPVTSGSSNYPIPADGSIPPWLQHEGAA